MTSGVELAVLLVMVHRLGASFACVVHVRLMVEEHMQHLIWLFASVVDLGMWACQVVLEMLRLGVNVSCQRP